MPEQPIPSEITVFAISDDKPREDYDRMRTPEESRNWWSGKIEKATLNVSQLQQEINIFVAQINQVLPQTPPKVDGFHLTEFEVTAGLTVKGKLAIFAIAGVDAEIAGSLKFVFKRVG